MLELFIGSITIDPTIETASCKETVKNLVPFVQFLEDVQEHLLVIEYGFQKFPLNTKPAAVLVT